MPTGTPSGTTASASGEPTNNHPEAKPGETKAETQQRIKMKLKVGGKEVEREFDENELQLFVQKGMGADEKFRTAAEVQKTFQQLQKALKENPFEALKDPAFGIDLEELAIQHLHKKFEMEDRQKKDPINFELEQLRAEKAQREAADRAAKEATTKAEQERAQREHDDKVWAQTEKEWVAALEESGFGPNKAYIQELLKIALEFNDRGLDLSPKHLITEFKERLSTQQKTTLGGLKGAQLLAYLGDDVVNEILATKVAALKAAKPVQEPIKGPEAPKSPLADENADPSASVRNFFAFKRGY